MCMKENECIAPDYGEWRCCVQIQVVLVFLFYQEQHNYIDITSDLKMANSHRQPVYAYCVVHIRILPCDIYFHIHYLNAQISL